MQNQNFQNQNVQNQNSVKSENFSQISTHSEHEENDLSLREQIELFFSILDSNTLPMSKYSINVNLVTKSKNQITLGTTNEKEGGSPAIDFDRTFIIDYFFETRQLLNISLLQDNKPILSTDVTVGRLMGSKTQTLLLDLQNNNGFTGKLKVHGIKIKTNDTLLKFNIDINFGNRNIKPYFIVKRNITSQNSNYIWIKAYKSEVLTNYPNVNKFQTVSLSTQFICNSDFDNKPVLFEFFDFNTNQVIGGYCNTVNHLLQSNGGCLSDPSGKPLNDMRLNFRFINSKNYKFLDYIEGGTQINMIVGLDFTGSNGDPHNPNSLHSLAYKPNLYEMAIESCCTTVAFYDNNQLFPVFGYGAILEKGTNNVNHCFNLNFTNDPNINTVNNVLRCYRNFIESGFKFWGPTHFGPIIGRSIDLCQSKLKTSDTYTILMILTDGIINDMQDAVNAIVYASTLPMSIIIIGIGMGGENGFNEMVFLDSDDKILINSNGQKAARDIIQFVEFRKFNNDQNVLAEEVLEEIPKQVEEYYSMVGKPPGKSLSNNQNKV